MCREILSTPTVGKTIMARVDYDPENRPKRVILGRREDRGDLYVAYVVSSGEVDDFEIDGEEAAFYGGAHNPVSLTQLSDILRASMKAEAAKFLYVSLQRRGKSVTGVVVSDETSTSKSSARRYREPVRES